VSGFDIALLVFMGVLAVVGLAKGLVRILVGMGALVTAFLVACFYHEPLADALAGLDLPLEVRSLISYGLLFLAVMLAGGLLAFVLRKIVKAAMLGWADRVGGGALGLAVAVLASALVVLPLVAYSPRGARLLERSVLAPYIAAVADLAVRVAPQGLADRYERGIAALREHWRGQPMDLVRR
jgi:membrane protein required for colicin V production